MASNAQQTDSLFDAGTIAARWIADYCGDRPKGDVLCTARGNARDAWQVVLEEVAGVSGEALDDARDRVQRHAGDIGTGFRVAGERTERPWPLSPIPLLIDKVEWDALAAGVAQRAELLEMLLADIYGAGRLVEGGYLPGGLVTGSPLFLRPMVGLTPPGGYHLHFYAVDLCRGPGGDWRVLGDSVTAPVGAGYALENRLAVARTLGGLQTRLNIERHAGFFAAYREGLAAVCRRSEPRIGLLTPGRYNPSYPEQAHLARYLGLLLVEGADLAVLEDRAYVRTIAGLKRVDALWRRGDPRLLDPLAFDATSAIGVPGIVDAMAAGNVVLSSSPGAGVVETPALLAFLPQLAPRLTGESLRIPNIATWWCGGEAERRTVTDDLDRMVIAPAFGDPPLGLPGGRAVLGSSLGETERAALLADMARRPQDYVGQEVVRLSTMPVVGEDDALAPRPFTLRMFAARDAAGNWTVLPGGFARIGEHPDVRAAVMGEGNWSADVCVHGPDPVAQVSLLPPSDSVHLRRNPGTLPSRVADNLFWLGRYLERGEAKLAAIRVLLGHSIGGDAGAALTPETLWRLVGLIADGGIAPPPSLRRADLTQFARTALEATEGSSVRQVNRQARAIGAGSRDRLSADMIRLLDAPFPTKGHLLDRAGSLQRRYAALAGLSAEHMARTEGWRFHDLGRRIERAMAVAAAVRMLGSDEATADDLSTLLDLANSQIIYRQRYLTGLARVPVMDLIALDPGNPRGIAYQAESIAGHLAALPVLSDDGLAEPQQALATELRARINIARAVEIDGDWLFGLEQRLAALSIAVARRYFLQGAEPLRAGGLTLA